MEKPNAAGVDVVLVSKGRGENLNTARWEKKFWNQALSADPVNGRLILRCG